MSWDETGFSWMRPALSSPFIEGRHFRIHRKRTSRARRLPNGSGDSLSHGIKHPLRNVTLTRPGNTVAGIDVNYGDTARFSGITIVNDSGRSMVICRKYNGNSSGNEPTQVGTGADPTNCFYSASDLTYR